MKRVLCGVVGVLASFTWVACGGSVASSEAAGSGSTGAGGATSTTTAGTTTSSSGSPAGPLLCQQVPCVPPDGGACGGCMTSCGPFTSTCASDPGCACVMAHGNDFCPGNSAAVTCMAQGTGSVSVTCGPCI